MRLSTLVGAPAGAGVFRDTRAWHGATPNVSREIRAMPNVEYGAPWLEAIGVQALDAARDLGGARARTRSASPAGSRPQPGEWPAGRRRHAPAGQQARQGEGRERDLTL